MKRLTSDFPEDYVRFALKAEPVAVERLQVEEVDKELPAVLREVDFAARVSLPEEQLIVLLEFQILWQNDMPKRIAGYTWRLFERYGLGVYPVVVVLRPGGRLKDEWRMKVLGRDIAKLRFEVIPLWEVKAEEVIERGWEGLYPLLPLMRWEDKGPEEVLEESQRLVLERVQGRELRADAYVALKVLSGIVHPEEMVRTILRRWEIMRESPFYKEILEEGRKVGLKEGMEKGLEEGMELGQEEGLRDALLEALEVRFGLVPPDLEEQVRRVRGRKLLEGLLRRAILAESLEAFREELGELECMRCLNNSNTSR